MTKPGWNSLRHLSTASRGILNGLPSILLSVALSTLALSTVPLVAQAPPPELQQLQQLLQTAEQQRGQGQTQAALETLQAALKVAQQTQQPGIEATVLLALGQAYQAANQPDSALSRYNQALVLFKQLNNSIGIAATLNNLGLVQSDSGQSRTAIELYQQALSILQRTNDRAGEAKTLSNLGQAYDNLGQPQVALERYEQALGIFRDLKDRSAQAVTLQNLGAVYGKLGQAPKAFSVLSEALSIVRTSGNPAAEIAILNNLGAVYLDSGAIDKALMFFNQALALIQKSPNPSAQATTLSNLGTIHTRLDQSQTAITFYQQALPLFKQLQDRAGEASTLNNLGAVYGQTQQPKTALSYYQQALQIRQQIGDRAGEAVTLSNLGETHRDLNQPTASIAEFEKAAERILSIRSGLQRQYRRQFLLKQRETGIHLVDLLIEQNQSERAFEWINLIRTSDLADFSRLIDAKVTNPDAQTALNQWNQATRELEGLRQQLQRQFSPQLSQQINQKQTLVNQQAATLVRQFPDVAELVETTPTDLAQLRTTIPKGTLVLQPVFLTDVKTIPNTLALFVLTQEKLTVTKVAIDPKQFDALLTLYWRQLRDARAHNYQETSAKLYDLLIRPVEAQIQATNPTQISIIAPEKLRQIPFETLYDQKKNQFLIEKYPINNLTRLSSRALKPQTLRSTISVLALGNPFPKDGRALPGAEAEVKAVTLALPGSRAYLGQHATLNRFKAEVLRFPLLHLATHGCFRAEGCPGLKMPANTLLFADRNLSIAEAATLGLKDVELIVLSACQTATQADASGEELAGMAYLFERAGAKAVIASLWSVDDQKTQALMHDFYQHLSQGKTKAEALRQAKIAKSKTHPYFWSPFVLIGDPQGFNQPS
jgi:CHAT domain-containing protein/Tfp pilus assembly protein PilF